MSAAHPFGRTRAFPRFWDLRAWRLAPKLIIAFLAVGLAPLSVTAVVTLRSTRAAMLAEGATDLVSDTRTTSTAIEQYLETHLEDIVMISGLAEIRSFAANPNDATAGANAVKALVAVTNKRDYESVAIVNTRGIVALSSDDRELTTNVAALPYFLEALKGASYVSDVYISDPSSPPVIYFSAPALDPGGNIAGVVRSRVSLNGIWNLVEQDRGTAGAGSFGTLLDENGIRIASSLTAGNREAVAQSLLYHAVAQLKPEVERQIVAEGRFGSPTDMGLPVLPLPEIAAAVASPGDVTFDTTADGSSAPFIGAIASVRVKPWHYVITTPLTTYTSATDLLQLFFEVVAVVVALATIVGVAFMARRFTQPIIQLTQVADRISLGELDAQIQVNSQDEIGDLAESLRRMQASLQGAIERLRSRRTSF